MTLALTRMSNWPETSVAWLRGSKQIPTVPSSTPLYDASPSSHCASRSSQAGKNILKSVSFTKKHEEV